MFGTAHAATFAEGVALVERGLALIASQDLEPVPAPDLGDDIKVLSSLTDRLTLQRTRRLTVFEREGGYARCSSRAATRSSCSPTAVSCRFHPSGAPRCWLEAADARPGPQNPR